MNPGRQLEPRQATGSERLVPVRLGPPLSAAAAAEPAVSTSYRPATTSGEGAHLLQAGPASSADRIRARRPRPPGEKPGPPTGSGRGGRPVSPPAPPKPPP